MFPIEKGLSMIEASAGTGKTYTLCRIVLRLIVEKEIPIDRILAITFTQAATEELISRIRELLHKAVHQLQSGEIEEEVLKQLIEMGKIDPIVATKRLRHSLEIFDDASISTIHGFCKRSLEFVSLESDIAFEANLEPIDDELIDRLQDEYVRINILEKSSLLSAFFAETPAYKNRLKTVARECSSHPYASLEPRPPEVSMEEMENAFDSFIESIDDFLHSADTLVPHLNKNRKFTKLVSDPAKRHALQNLARRKFLLLSDLPLLLDLTSDAWKKALKKASSHLEPPVIIKRTETLLGETETAFACLTSNYREWLFENLRAEKERRNIVSFNDLLHILNRALNDDRGDTVANAISEQYDAALVDEFQDTDPTQYNIIQRLFGDGTKYLFLIGDPKQAIYRFRGADIFSYFNATDSKVSQRIQLSDNYRSSPTLVHAVNRLFQSSPDGFAFDKIQFHPTSPARAAETNVPLRIEAIGLDKPTPLGQSRAVELLASQAAEDLAQRVSREPDLELGKVAFLVGTNREADAILDSLAQRGIDGALRAERSVFESDETDSMLQLLETLSHPSKASSVRALLLTPIGGYNWVDLIQSDFEDQSQEAIEYLHEWSRNWHSSNFDASFQQLLRITGATRRMLGTVGGERQYTNLCQLSELLQSEALTRLSTPKHLFDWLLVKKDENVSSQENWQTRLTSDEGKPQIVTIHKSKGLQFPIVICPFLSLLQPRAKRDYALYHAPDRNDKMIIHLTPEEGSQALEQAEREEYAEQLRLIYVALTRAVDECSLYLCPEECGPRQKRRPSSFSQLVLGSENASNLLGQNKISAALLKRIQEFDSDCVAVIERSLLESSQIPTTPVAVSRQKGLSVRARTITQGAIPVSERILSFSTITRMAHAHDLAQEEIDNDEIEFRPIPEPEIAENDTEIEPEGPTVFNLPKGAHTGNLFHSILEALDFQNPDSIGECVHQAITRLRYGHAEHRPAVIELFQTLLRKPLSEGLSLDHISPSQRIPELEFAYPTSVDTLRKIRNALAKHPSPRIPRSWVEGLNLSQNRVGASMLRGFIDLVFEHNGQIYILDWKSNHLGNRVSDYRQESMETAMSQHDYYLQYCLYAVAVKRYLGLRSPQTDFHDRFGGVYYLFLRGISEREDSGVFFDRPNRDLLNALDEAIGE